MSASASGSAPTTKAVTSDDTSTNPLKDQQQKPAAALEEDDEFEDFPVEGNASLFSPNIPRFTTTTKKANLIMIG
ncbi:MAG: hypothetical protein Q9208_001108 [Pyrenodesmia sp. 3 TL-2023]